MGIDHVGVDPCLRLLWQVPDIYLPCRYDDLFVVSVDHVPVHIDVIESIIGSEQLQLLVCALQRSPVP